MPNSQPQPSRLQDGAVAVTLDKQDVFAGPDGKHPLSHGLAKDDEVTVLGEPAIGAGKRWWRVHKHGDSGVAWAVECDHDRYYLEPKNGVGVSGPIIHVVKPGEYWGMIATQYHTTIEALQHANPELVRPKSTIYPGDRIKIPG